MASPTHKYPVARWARSTMLYTLVGMFSLMLIPVFLVYSLILILAKPIFPRWTGAQFKQYGRSIWCVALFLLAPILTRLSWHSIWVVYPGTKREKNKFMCVSPAHVCKGVIFCFNTNMKVAKSGHINIVVYVEVIIIS
jgi:hypothetical protein